jgi:hypothetical protein
MLSSRLLLLLLGLPSLPTLSDVSAQELHVEGNFRKWLYFQGKTNQDPVYPFTVDLKECGWRIRSKCSSKVRFSDYMEACFDGTNIYFLNSIKSAVEAQQRKGADLGPNPNTALGTVYRGQVCNREEIAPAWLAYASGCYFKSQTNEFVEPALEEDANSAMIFGPPDHLTMRARWILTDSQPIFISHLAYLSDGSAMNRLGKFAKRQVPYDLGFTNSCYEVESFTNVDGLSIPLVSHLKVFREKTNAVASTDLALLLEYRISLTSARRHAESVISQPMLAGVTAVQDFRVATDVGPQVSWYLTSNKWLTEPELPKLSLSKQPVRHQTTSVLVRAGLFVVFIGPALGFVAWRVYARFWGHAVPGEPPGQSA